MRLSVVMPAVYIKDYHVNSTKEAIKSLNNVDELILIETGELKPDFEADIKIRIKDRGTIAKAINLGMKNTTGDYIAVVHNDIKVEAGNLKDLCKKGVVTSPKANGEKQDFWGCFFVVPREVYEKVGGFDEAYENHYDDTDYIEKLKDKNISMECIDKVSVKHKGDATASYFNKKVEENKKIFEKKWGKDSDQ